MVEEVKFGDLITYDKREVPVQIPVILGYFGQFGQFARRYQCSALNK